MKILFLTYPYLGAEYLAEELANASNYNFIPDPMNLNWYGAKTIINKADGDGNIIQEEVTYPRKYIFPDAIPENTVVTHNVCWHTLPNNLTETQFLEQFIPKFDKVICLRKRDLTLNWKRWAVSVNQPHEDNFYWDMHLAKNCNLYIQSYEDSHYDQAKVDKINECDLFLENYYDTNGSAFVESFVDDYFKDSATGENVSSEIIDFQLKRFGIPFGDVEYDFENEVWNNIKLYEVCNQWIPNRY